MNVLPSSGSTSMSPTQLEAFLAAERQLESGNNYSAYNPGGGASGAYQFIQSTWSSEAQAAGFNQYANAPAADAPPSVQDAVAANMATDYYSQFGNWKDTAEAWYYPAWAGNPQYQNSVPYPSAGNTLTIGQYGTNVVDTMNSILQNGGSGDAVLASYTTSANSSSGSSSSGGFLHSLDQTLNPNFGANPFTDTAHGIDMAIVRGGLVLLGLLMVAAGLSIIVLGTVNVFAVGKKAAGIAKVGPGAIL